MWFAVRCCVVDCRRSMRSVRDVRSRALDERFVRTMYVPIARGSGARRAARGLGQRTVRTMYVPIARGHVDRSDDGFVVATR
jgi:hypothetical protein